ncbi:MAG: 30S ribosomal protein S17 [Candidatus Pacebacteria bacterium]|nr:30S ribosomal protein S17 [Candidatus Paceibacterota bacterium]
MNNLKTKKRIQGVVVSSKMKDTATVLVERYTKHPKYKKYIKKSKKFHIHDLKNTAKIGDKVLFEETRPISKIKKFKLIEIKK